MKNTALTDIHMALGAKMAEFAGYNMPIQYAGVVEEHLCVREKLGVFDVSHMGEFLIDGEKALELIQKATSNDASKLTDGKVQYSCLPNKTGGIVDDLLVYRFSETKYLLVVNASNIEKDWLWLSDINKSAGAKMTDISGETSLLAVQGPLAVKAMQSLTDVKLDEIGYYSFVTGVFSGVKDVIISATGYTGSGGFEFYFPNAYAKTMWDEVLRAGKSYGIQPVGLGARDTLRLEKGFCLYGNDIDDTTSPIEAGLSWITKFTKEFTNSEALKKQKEEGAARKLVGFELIDRGVPRHAYPVCDASGKEIGAVTSGTMSPSLKIPLGLAYVPEKLSAPESEIYIKVRDKLLKARVRPLPFL